MAWSVGGWVGGAGKEGGGGGSGLAILRGSVNKLASDGKDIERKHTV